MQRLQLKMKFLVSYNMKIAIWYWRLTFEGGGGSLLGESFPGAGVARGSGGAGVEQIFGLWRVLPRIPAVAKTLSTCVEFS